MLPQPSDHRWVDLVSGKIDHQFKSVPAGLCVSRNIRAVAQNEKSPQECVQEVHAFFTKYEAILGDDIAAVFS